MMKTRTNLIVALFALCFTGTVSDAYAWGWHKRKSVKNDSVVTSESKYDELVKKAKTREGMFRIHQVEKDWYFEIDDSLMNRDLQITSSFCFGPCYNIRHNPFQILYTVAISLDHIVTEVLILRTGIDRIFRVLLFAVPIHPVSGMFRNPLIEYR